MYYFFSIPLIHTYSRCYYTTAYIRYACHFKKSLYRAILSIKTMKNRENHIQFKLFYLTILIKYKQRLVLCIRRDNCLYLTFFPSTAFNRLYIRHQEPLTLFAYYNNLNIIFICINCLYYACSAYKRNLVFT